MTPAEAARLLELPADATPEQIEARFLELRRKLEDKIAKAPTSGLQAKYRESLTEITTAFETLAIAADSSALPVLKKEAGDGRPEAGKTSDGSAATLPRDPDSGIRSQVSGLPPPKKAKSGREFALVAIIAVVVLGAGGWFVMKTRAENAEKARIEAIAQTEAAERKAQADAVAAAARERAAALGPARKLVEQATTAFDQGDIATAAEWLAAALEYVPDLPEAKVVQRRIEQAQLDQRIASLLRKADADWEADRLTAALEALREVKALAPADESLDAAVNDLAGRASRAIDAAIDDRDASLATTLLNILGELATLSPGVVLADRTAIAARIAALPRRVPVSTTKELVAAMSRAKPGDIIELAEGFYFTEGLAVAAPLELQGQGDPARTIIRQARGFEQRPLLFVNRFHVTLANLTLEQVGETDAERRHGLLALNNGADVTLQNVRISGAVGNGISVGGGSTLNLQNVRIVDSAWNGIDAHAADTTITAHGLTASGNRYGVYLRQGSNLQIDGSDLSKNDITGLVIRDDGSSATLRQLSLDSNGSYGADIQGNHTVGLYDVKVRKNKRTAIYLSGETLQATINGLTIEDNGNGLSLSTSIPTTVVGVRARRNGGQAVQLKGRYGNSSQPTFTLRDSIIEDNRSSGVWVEYARFRESGNTVRNNTGYNYMTPDRKR